MGDQFDKFLKFDEARKPGSADAGASDTRAVFIRALEHFVDHADPENWQELDEKSLAEMLARKLGVEKDAGKLLEQIKATMSGGSEDPAIKDIERGLKELFEGYEKLPRSETGRPYESEPAKLTPGSNGYENLSGIHKLVPDGLTPAYNLKAANPEQPTVVESLKINPVQQLTV